MYKCDRCGLKVSDAYMITKYFNDDQIVQTVCKDCIEKIGHDNEVKEDVERE